MKKIKFSLRAVMVMILLAMPFVLSGCFGLGESKPKLELFNEFKTEYYVGEELNLTNAILKYTKEGNTFYEDVTLAMVDGFDSSTPGEKKLIITYDGLSIEVEYTIFQNIESLNLFNPFKTQYYVGEYLNLTDGQLKYTLNGKSEYPNITADMIEGFNSATAGEKTMLIKYKGLTIEIPYVVKENVENLELSISFKTKYYIGDSLDLSNGKLKYTLNQNVYYVDVNLAKVEGFNSSTAGERKLLITYHDLTIEVGYTVVERLSMADKTVYYGEYQDGEEAVFQLFYIDRSTMKMHGDSALKSIVGDGRWAASQFKTNDEFAMSFVEKVINDKKVVVVSGLGGEGVSLEMHCIPNEDGSIVMQGVDENGDLVPLNGKYGGPTSVTLVPFTEEDQEVLDAMPKMADKTVYYGEYQDVEEVGFQLLYIDRSAKKIYGDGALKSIVGDGRWAASQFNPNDEFARPFAEKVINNKKVVVVSGLGGEGVIIEMQCIPNEDGSIVVQGVDENGDLVPLNGKYGGPTSMMLVPFTEEDQEALDSMPKIADKTVYYGECQVDEEVGFQLFYIDRSTMKIHGDSALKSIVGDGRWAASQFKTNDEYAMPFVEKVINDKKVIVVSGLGGEGVNLEMHCIPNEDGSMVVQGVDENGNLVPLFRDDGPTSITLVPFTEEDQEALDAMLKMKTNEIYYFIYEEESESYHEMFYLRDGMLCTNGLNTKEYTLDEAVNFVKSNHDQSQLIPYTERLVNGCRVISAVLGEGSEQINITFVPIDENTIEVTVESLVEGGYKTETWVLTLYTE